MIPSWLGSHGCGLCLKMTTAVFAARVGTSVQPLQGENYTYSRVLGHVQLWIWHHTVVRTTYTFLPPSSTTFPTWIAAEVWGEGVPALTQG